MYQEVDVKIPRKLTFYSKRECLEFIEEEGVPFKLTLKESTYTPEGVVDLIWVLEHIPTEIGEFTLIECPRGIPLLLKKDGADVYIAMERKKNFSFGAGVYSKLLGEVVWRGHPKNKICREGVGWITKANSNSQNGSSAWSVFVVAEDIVYGIGEGTCGNGERERGESFGGAIAFGVPPFPYPFPGDQFRGVPILGLNEEKLKHIVWDDIIFLDGERVCGGTSGHVGDVTGWGKDFRELGNRIRRVLRDLTIPNLVTFNYSLDEIERDYHQLKKWGWI